MQSSGLPQTEMAGENLLALYAPEGLKSLDDDEALFKLFLNKSLCYFFDNDLKIA